LIFFSLEGEFEQGPMAPPPDKPLKTPAREPPNERKGAIGLLEVGTELKYSPGVIETEGAWGSFPVVQASFIPQIS